LKATNRNNNYKLTWLSQVADDGTDVVSYGIYLDYATVECDELSV